MKPFTKGIDRNVCLRTRKQKPLMNAPYKANCNLQKVCRKLSFFISWKWNGAERILECCYCQPNSGQVTLVPSKEFLYPNHEDCESNLYLRAVLHGRR